MVKIRALGNALLLFIQIYYFILLGRIILSWFQPAFYGNPAMNSLFRFFYALTEPFLVPLRRVLPAVQAGRGYLDLSPLVLLLLLVILRSLIYRYLL